MPKYFRPTSMISAVGTLTTKVCIAARQFSIWSMICVFSILIFHPAVFAQQPQIKWGDIPRADLEMKSFPEDSNAAAVILFDLGKVWFSGDFKMTFERHRRIKILTEGGYEWADYSIGYYAKDKIQWVTDVEGQTISLAADGSVKKTKLDKKSIFNEDVDGTRRRIRFTLPALAPGAIIEYRYKVHSSNPIYLHDWEFQSGEPTRWSEFRAEVPGVLQYVQVRQGVLKFDIAETEEQNWSPMLAYAATAKQYNLKIMAHRWVMKDLPALRDEPFMTTVDDYRAKIHFQLASVTWPGLPPDKVMNTWEKLAEDLMSHQSFGEQIERHKILRQQAEALVAGLTDPEAKMRAIYDYVRTNIAWNEERGIFTEIDLDKAYAARRAGGPEIALMLCGMLRFAGFEAHPVLVSTRDNGKIIQLYSIIAQFNHVLTYAKIGARSFLLDATDPLRPCDLLSVQALNEVGWLVDKKNPRWVDIVSPGVASQNTMVLAALGSDGAITGRLTSTEAGYRALFSRRGLRDKKDNEEEYIRETWLKDFAAAQVDSFTITNRDSTKLPLISAVNFSTAEYAQAAGDNIYLNPIFFHRQNENPLKLPERTFPVDYAYGRKTNYALDLSLPEGYSVQELPADVTLALPKNGGVFRRHMEVSENRLHVESHFAINRTRFDSSEYESLQNFYDRIVAAQAEQIVLKRNDVGQKER